ncbi:MAG: putative sulfite/organosulfonate exporter TauE [Phycisphaerae bacterium]|nr:putative sulfite/organosulfonate exporter TauE [Phycisphaerae bacterium]
MPEQLLLLGAICLLASLLQGVTGFGFSLIVIAVLAALGSGVQEASYIANILALFCQGLIIYRLLGHFSWRAAWPFIVGAAVTLPLGVWLLMAYGRRPWIVQVLGVFVIVVALWLLVAPRRPHVVPRPRRLLGIGAGVLGGLASGMFNTGGPPAVLYVYSRPIPLDTAKATIQWLFTGMSLVRLSLLVSQGRIGGTLVLHALSVAPLVILGAWIGLRIARRVHPELLRKLVYVLLIAIGVKLMF